MVDRSIPQSRRHGRRGRKLPILTTAAGKKKTPEEIGQLLCPLEHTIEYGGAVFPNAFSRSGLHFSGLENLATRSERRYTHSD